MKRVNSESNAKQGLSIAESCASSTTVKQTKTLAAIAADIENGNIYYNETTIKAGQFGTFADFLSYYRQHYRSILQAIADGEDLTAQPPHLLRFMASDLLELLAEDDEDEDTEDFGVMLVTFADAENYEHAKRIFDSTGESDFWAGDYDDQTRTVEFTESGDLDALETALSVEMTKYGISGYTFNSHRVRA